MTRDDPVRIVTWNSHPPFPKEIVISASNAHGPRRRPAARRADLTGRTLMAITGISTLIPFVNGIGRVANAPEAYMLTEFWRTSAYLVFAGLWGLLAWAPRRQRGVWELVLIQKTAVSVFALVNLGATDSVRDSISDSSLAVATAVAYVLCRGWHAWRPDDVTAAPTYSPALPG